MKKVSILTISIASILIILSGICIYYWSKSFTGKIDSVTKAKPGQLIVISASKADGYKWSVLPDNHNYIVQGKDLIFSSYQEGEYLFICAMTKNNKVDLVIHKVRIGPDKTDNKTDFRSLIISWLPQDQSNKSQVAFIFKIAATQAQSVDQLVKLTAQSTNQLSNLDNWKDFLRNVSAYCKINLEGKPLSDHQIIWNEIARALSE